MFLRSLTLCLLIPMFLFCKTSNEEHEAVSYKEGWHYKRNKKGEDEKFFAIGAWSIPGYTPDRNGRTDRSNEQIFKMQARNINIYLTHQLNLKEFMAEDDRIVMTTIGSDFLRGSNFPDFSNKGLENGYYRSQYLKNAVNTQDFSDALDVTINKSINSTFANIEVAYLPIDEVALGIGAARWYWSIPPEVGDKIYERLSLFDPNLIVFVDLAGHGKGGTFFFEKRYLKDYPSMPTDPPYDAIVNESARDYALNLKASGKGTPLLGFYESYDGVPTYQYNKESSAYTIYAPEELKTTHYENIKAYASAYKGNGNVFGINAFRDFYALPALAGITVDAIKDGLKDPTIPIWLFFDGNGYAKPSGIPAKSYANEVKCQIYTSIIHGATGVFFWNDMSKTPDVWNYLQPILEEMKDNLDIIKQTTIEKRINGDIHIIIKENTNGQKYIIATNTSKTSAVALKQVNVEKKVLLPLEVYISPFS